jgi:hypothetical protein
MASLILNGSTSGSITISSPAVSGSNTLTLPASTGTVALTAAPTFTGQATIPTINLTGGQITFPATQSASADANTLDDYEEGTWTPVLTFGNVAGVSTYSQQNGTYTKVGNTVTVRGYFAIGTKSAATGAARITGLPFTTKSGTAQYHTANIYMAAQSITGAPMCYIAPNDTVVELGQSNGSNGFASTSNANFSNSGDFIFQATYIAS